MTPMADTDAARDFSAVLDRVAAGEEIEVMRNGKLVAVIAPAGRRSLSAERFRDVLVSAPAVDGSFADDLRALRAELKAPPDAWEL